MDAIKKERLTAAGIDVDSVPARFMGNEVLLEQMLHKFAKDTNFQKLLDAHMAQPLDTRELLKILQKVVAHE